MIYAPLLPLLNCIWQTLMRFELSKENVLLLKYTHVCMKVKLKANNESFFICSTGTCYGKSSEIRKVVNSLYRFQMEKFNLCYSNTPFYVCVWCNK